MAKKKEDDSGNLDAPIQSDEARQRVLEKSSAGPLSAVGVAREDASGATKERLDSLESRGSTQPIAGGDSIGADYPPHDAPKATGAQAQAANYSTNGTLPINHVASPSGLVPASAVTSDPEQARKLIEDQMKSAESVILRSGFEKLSRAKIESMSPADLRAVASDRGYDLGEYGGARVTRRRFVRAQAEDKEMTDLEEGQTVEEPSTTDTES
jgi:hypothetical protein